MPGAERGPVRGVRAARPGPVRGVPTARPVRAAHVPDRNLCGRPAP